MTAKLPAMLAALVLAAPLAAQRLVLDASGAFYATSADRAVAGIAAQTNAGSIAQDAYLRYPVRRASVRRRRLALEDLGFDFVLARECESRGLARSAPALAPALAARRLLDSDRVRAAQADGSLRARFATEALRQLRIDALVGARRQVDPDALRARFEQRYGVDGVHVRVRHILVAADPAGEQQALARARALRDRLRGGEPFAALLSRSDDRLTRRLLRDPLQQSEAGFVAGYNYRRYGEHFAAAVRQLEVGAVSEPVRSSLGYHLIELVERKVTEYARVLEGLKKELGGGKATQSEVSALRRELLAKYEFRVTAEAAAALARGRAEADTTPAVIPVDWPHYRGNPQLHGVAAGRLGDKPALAWTFLTKGEILSSPVVVGGTVYIGSTDNSVYAIDLRTGKQRWAFATKDMVEAPPLVLDGRVYIGSSDFFLYALDALSGALLWKFETEDKILGGANWFTSEDGRQRIVVGSYDARVYCLDARTGTRHWAYETDNYVNGTPAVANGEILFGGCDTALHLVDAETGERITKIELGGGCQVAGSVAVADDKAYFGHYGNEFLRVDLDSGEIDWRYASKRDGFCSSPAVGNKYVVFGGRDKLLHCVLRADGTPQWTFPTRRKVDGSPVICGDKVVFGSGDGRLYLLRLADGEQLWSYDIGRSVYSTPAVCEGMIVVGATDNRVYAFSAPGASEKGSSAQGGRKK